MIEITIKCYCCEKVIDSDDIHIQCNQCTDDDYNVITKDFAENTMTGMEQSKQDAIEGDWIIGFNSEIEKAAFLRGVKRGYEWSILQILMIAEHYGIDISKKYKEIESGWDKQKVNPALVNEE